MRTFNDTVIYVVIYVTIMVSVLAITWVIAQALVLPGETLTQDLGHCYRIDRALVHWVMSSQEIPCP